MTTVLMSGAPTFEWVFERCQLIAEAWAGERLERQQRTSLDPQEFRKLQDAGLHLIAVPVEHGGLWSGVRRSTRPICDILRTLAHGDASVALVTVMHPAVLQNVLGLREAPQPYAAAWAEERRWIFESILDGAWWGTLGSEPGTASDREPVAATARRDPDGLYRLTGKKHFGTGSGIVSYMVTAAIPDGEPSAESFFLEMRGVPLDGSAGIRLASAWDGHGMPATQSHSFEFEHFPAIRSILPRSLHPPESPFFPCAYIAVVLGVVEAALAEAQRQLTSRGHDLLPYEQVEWTDAVIDAWLMHQAFEGMLHAIENRHASLAAQVMQGKIACGRLAESAMTRICRLIGARTYSRSSPFGHWFEDVRALGFLRPGWRVAYQDLWGFLNGATVRGAAPRGTSRTSVGGQ